MTLLVENLEKSFGQGPIFSKVSFEIQPGEIVCIQGKSGEGKTTLLRCLLNLEKVDKGSIRIGKYYLCKKQREETIYASREELLDIRKEIGLVFQDYNLFPHLTVAENLVEAPLYMSKREGKDVSALKEELESRARKLIEKLDLSGRENFYPYQLSGGQQQRVAIARACMLEPSILCFDEPTSALDDETKDQIFKIIKGLADQGISIIIVTHDRLFVEKIASRIFHMKEGQLAEE